MISSCIKRRCDKFLEIAAKKDWILLSVFRGFYTCNEPRDVVRMSSVLVFLRCAVHGTDTSMYVPTYLETLDALQRAHMKQFQILLCSSRVRVKFSFSFLAQNVEKEHTYSIQGFIKCVSGFSLN